MVNRLPEKLSGIRFSGMTRHAPTFNFGRRTDDAPNLVTQPVLLLTLPASPLYGLQLTLPIICKLFCLQLLFHMLPFWTSTYTQKAKQ